MKPNLHKVEERLTYLYSIKQDLNLKQRDWAEQYTWVKRSQDDPYKSSYRTWVIFSIINAKAAEILTWTQEYDFIPLDGEASSNVKLVKEIWKYEWLHSKTDKSLANVIYSALKYWDWFLYEWTRRIDRKIKTPYYDSDWKIKIKEEVVTDYDGIYSEYIPWENFYFDWIDINEANEAIWIKHWNRDDYINTFSENPNFKNINNAIPKWRYYYADGSNSLVLPNTSNNEDNIISELRYYNKAKDELVILANWIEVYNSIIPYKHKELPFCVYSDYSVDNRTYSMWEYELLERDAAYKDALRSLTIDVIKAQFWFTAISPEADFDETTVEIWTNSFARVDPNDIRHFAPNISANSIQAAEQQADNDIIVKSWIDFKSQILWPSETATKVVAKTQSARKRINLNLKMNWYSFFERLARLRMSNIQLEYWSEYKKIPVKWWDIDSKWVYSPINWWYWFFTVKPELVKWKFNILPITESILWISTERDKASILEFAQVAWNIMWEDGKPVIKPAPLVKAIANKYWVNYEELTQVNVTHKSPEDILKEAEMEMNGESTDVTNPSNPEYIPPEQRSWATKSVPTIGSMWNTLPL